VGRGEARSFRSNLGEKAALKKGALEIAPYKEKKLPGTGELKGESPQHAHQGEAGTGGGGDKRSLVGGKGGPFTRIHPGKKTVLLGKKGLDSMRFKKTTGKDQRRRRPFILQKGD